MQKSCAVCQVTFDAKRSDGKYCSPRCGRRGTKPCSVEDCERPSCVAQPRRLCSTHYNRAQYTTEQRHKKTLVDCTWCGKPHLKHHRGTRYGGTFCSLVCRDAWRHRQVELRKLPVLFVGTVVRPALTRPVAPKQRASRLFVAGTCVWCGTAFVDRQLSARFCSRLCGRRYWRKRGKEQEGVSDAVRRHVYARDRWRCRICGRRIRRNVEVPHPLAATVDHVVPRSQGGSHEPANLRAAHFICNARRGARGGGEQLLLLG